MVARVLFVIVSGCDRRDDAGEEGGKGEVVADDGCQVDSSCMIRPDGGPSGLGNVGRRRKRY